MTWRQTTSRKGIQKQAVASKGGPTSGEPRRIVADLHVHSRFAMGTSPSLTVRALWEAGRRKGIDLLATGDFTHPAWLKELKENLVEHGGGIFQYRGADAAQSEETPQIEPLFLLGTELSCNWQQWGRNRRVHFLVLAPSFQAVSVINRQLGEIARLESDGRPALGISAAELLRMLQRADERSLLIPAHIWTPWYGVFGSKSGFDSLEECFGDLTPEIRAVETGLSSDPAMNWTVPELAGRSIVSFSDAHSTGTLGREATIFHAAFDYNGVATALKHGAILQTVEFFPENGKYHLNGHRKCGVQLTPEQTPEDGRCPVCRRPLTLGVLHRVGQLAAAPIAFESPADGEMIRSVDGRPPFRRVVPLRDVIAEALNVGPKTRRVDRVLDELVASFGSELRVLLDVSQPDLDQVAGSRVAGTIRAFRNGAVQIDAGYDGLYGAVHARTP